MPHITAFITRWNAASGSERANYQLFLTELCELLDLPRPEPASDDSRDNAYVFERRVDIHHADGSVNRGFIDLYRRGSFILEAKQTGKTLDTGGWNSAMLRAQNQADQYARALPANEGRPPFIVVVDVGRSIELYAEFTRSGSTYVPYPDPAHHRIRLDDLRDAAIRERLKLLWLDPLKLDPSRESARVTRAIADQLAKLAKSLEADGHAAQRVAHFLMRALFTMFAEDVGLLPTLDGKGAFTSLLESLQDKPTAFAPALENLWQTMNHGGFDTRLMERIRQFNGGLFATPDVIPLTRDQISLLLQAALADWRYVEPAIFGTLLERALDPRERHKLGAHYTPRAYVERLVLPTLIEPLRRDWQTVQIAAQALSTQGKPDKALDEVRVLHRQLCTTRVLDPACGSGNFLYVALEHMKRLEGEVLNLIRDLSAGQVSFDTAGLTIDPHQFFGLEINPRAAAIAEIVLWIGYLQWHHRIHKTLEDLPDPVLRDFHNIEHRDALITYDRVEYLSDETGRPLTRWDGISFKPSPVTGENIPDESARVPVERYLNPRKAVWPQADYIIGNPPYIGARRIRMALGDGYLDALRNTYPEIPENADFVMYWWSKSVDEIGAGRTRRFGLITTNSMKQTFSRKVVETSLASNPNASILFVVPDHPWVDTADGAAVRVTLTTVGSDQAEGIVARVIEEHPKGDGEIEVELEFEQGFITPNLSIGVDPAMAIELSANSGTASVGYQLTGKGFILEPDQARKFTEANPEDDKYIKLLMTGRDITQTSRGLFVIDLFGLDELQLRRQHPGLYQWVFDRVKPERDQNKDAPSRQFWWLFARPRAEFRPALHGVETAISTSLTARHRIFVRVPANTICDSTTVMFALPDAFHLGILSSRIHVAWSLAVGGTLEDRPRYNKTRCFETFPFPDLCSSDEAQRNPGKPAPDSAQAPSELRERIAHVAEQIDAHRKRQQAAHPELTLTGLYNVLEKLRSGETLNAKDKTIHEAGLVSVLKTLHDELDVAVLKAYGWDDLVAPLVGQPGATTPLPDKPAEQAAAEEELLMRLVALNAQRATEEAQGHIRWLRPEYQNPQTTSAGANSIAQPGASAQTEADFGAADEVEAPRPAASTQDWPKELREQIQTVRALLTSQAQSTDTLAARFKRKPAKAVQTVLEALQGLGLAQHNAEGWRA